MKTLNIQIPEGYEVDKEKSNFDESIVIFKKIEKEYPDSIFKVWSRAYPIREALSFNVSSFARAEAFIALMQLVELRDAWNDIDGGREFYKRGERYEIRHNNGNFVKDFSNRRGSVLEFHNQSTRNLFLETFKDLLETAKELI
jgi:hypothetical protein